jgi:hypothetical protein
MKKNLYLSLFLLLLCACTGMKVTIHKPFVKSESTKKIAVFEVILGKPVQGIFPLIDAGIFNGKMNKIADEISDVQRKRVTLYRETLSAQMKKKFGCEIISGKDLQALSGFAGVKEKLEKKQSLLTGNDNYPVMYLADGEFNIFSFEKGRVHDEEITTKSEVAEICKALEVDAIAINYTRINVENVGSFGISANARLFTDLYIFKNDGRKVAHGAAYSEVTSIHGKEVADYIMLLDEFTLIIDPLTSQLISPIK